ncbi:PRC-barrel domain-containing protein [Billgrantia endophytica]|uniref:PRC-barrel domain-containing protein n=1 Tax=Billgrantia endophytica TaxID=2033802 RepID=A0A2N7U1Z6_9GAMM|nr:PRC-barrel domain-containing protein [Halomonas endophytica]PMR74452.1 hypothetical protein C1H69_14500 [Halomonas endophytica]
MKRTLLAIAIGAISAGIAGGALAQETEDDIERNGDATMSEEQTNQDTDDTQAADDDGDQEDLDIDDDDLDAEGDDADDYEEMDPEDMDVEETDTEQTGEAPQTDADDAFDEMGAAEATLDESLGAMQVSELEGMTVINMEDEEIGDIQSVVKHNDTGDLHAVVTVGGFWGMGGTDITLPLAEMQLEDEQLVFQQTYGEDELESSNEYDEDRYSDVDDDMTLSDAWGL